MKTLMEKQIGRRALIQAGMLAAGSAVMAPALSQSGPVKIGLVLAKQGFFAELGDAQAAGAQIALAQANNRVLGRPIELIWYDEASPQTAQLSFSKLVEEDKVVGIVGGTGSGTALAMTATAKRLKTPFIVSGAAAREITGKECNRYTFRIIPTVPTLAAALAPSMLERGKEWYFVVASYAYGQDVHAAMKAELLKAGGREIGVEVIPANTTDYSGFLLKVRAARPKLLVLGIGGSDNTAFIKQYAEFGMDKTTPLISPLISDSHMWAMGDKPMGLFGKAWQYSDPSNSEAEKAFIKIYQEKFQKPPMVEVWQGWVAMRMLLAAIEDAKATESKAIVQSLETMELANGASPLKFRSWDHQLVRPILLVQGRKPPGGDKWDVLETLRRVPTNMADLDRTFGDQATVGCTLGDF